jgi:hypothetical protein
MDFSKLRTGELIAGICGVLLLIVMFFSWYGGASSVATPFGNVDASGVTVDAWEAFSYTDLLLALTALVAIGAAVLAASGRSVALPVAASVVVTVLGIVVVLLVLYRIINQPGDNDFVDVKFGAYLGFLVCLGIAVGGFLAMADEGATPGGGGGTAAAAPPPQAAPPPAAPPSGGEPPEGGGSAPPPSTPPPGSSG